MYCTSPTPPLHSSFLLSLAEPNGHNNYSVYRCLASRDDASHMWRWMGNSWNSGKVQDVESLGVTTKLGNWKNLDGTKQASLLYYIFITHSIHFVHSKDTSQVTHFNSWCITPPTFIPQPWHPCRPMLKVLWCPKPPLLSFLSSCAPRIPLLPFLIRLSLLSPFPIQPSILAQDRLHRWELTHLDLHTL